MHLRHLGSEKYGFTTWVRLSDIDFQTGGILDPNKTGADVPFEDLYRVLWFFERVEIALDRKIVKPDVLMQTIGFHCWWWNELLAHIEAPKATAALRSIGPTAREWAANTRQLDDWVSRCKTDFNGGGPILKTHQELAKTLMAEPI